MPLTSGTRLGSYEIIATLGAGGMGEVYRARDVRLGRDVAIKVLRDLVAGDADRIARFRREAQLLASLNHPQIGAIYGVEESGGFPALVLELVEGATLADRIASSRIEIGEALGIARQIAEALEAAHGQGVIHRDLKPANVKVTPDGRVKVLDFGLAKMIEGDAPGTSLTNSPTLSVQGTLAGVILGTAAYMSPEQARGKPLDRRTDIWSFGCVLFEMLTAKQAFAAGETVSDAVAAILKSEPDWSAVPAETPAAVRRLLRRCLTKDPRERLHDIADARLEIRDAHFTETGPRTDAPRTHGAWIAAAVLAILSLALAGVLLWRSTPTPADLPVYRSVILPPGLDPKTADGRTSSRRFPRGLALSPDGRRLAFVAPGPDGRAMLWVRPLDSPTAQMLGGTEGAAGPFWSPDGRQLGFVAQARLKRIDAGGGSPVTLHDGATALSGTWNRDNVILFSAVGDAPILRISAAGGAATPATSLDTAKGETAHVRPFFLPDGRRFLYRAVKGVVGSGVLYVGSLDSKERTEIHQDVNGHAYANGFLLFVRGTTLVAQRFDADRLEVSGEERPVLEQVRIGGALLLSGALSVSESGVLVYQNASSQQSQLAWFDRSGKEVAVLGEAAQLSYLQLSPDGRQAAVTVQESVAAHLDLWLYDTVRGGRTRVTSDPSDETSPVWSPDGERLAFLARRRGDDDLNLYQVTLNSKVEERLLATPTLEIPTSWSRDGRFVLYQTNPGIWSLPVSGDRKPIRLEATRGGGNWAQFSPDGRWIAYNSGETGRPEVYIAPFQRPGRTVPVSTRGGTTPRWREDGKEIFYLGENDTLVAVAVRGGDSAIELGDATPLFQARFSNTPLPYAVAPDGQRFLINRPVEDTSDPPITLVVNWPEALKK